MMVLLSVGTYTSMLIAPKIAGKKKYEIQKGYG